MLPVNDEGAVLPLRLDLAPPVLLLLPPAQVPQSVTSSDLHLSPVMKVQRGSQPLCEAAEAAVNLTTDREHEVQSVKTNLHDDDDDDPPGGLGLGGAETEDTLVVVRALRLSVLLSDLRAHWSALRLVLAQLDAHKLSKNFKNEILQFCRNS